MSGSAAALPSSRRKKDFIFLPHILRRRGLRRLIFVVPRCALVQQSSHMPVRQDFGVPNWLVAERMPRSGFRLGILADVKT